MWRCAALVAIVAIVLVVFCSFPRDDLALRALENHVLLCTVCSYVGDVASAPITFAACLYKNTFVTQVEPLVDAQDGQYTYKKTGARRAVLQLRQPDKEVLSKLHLLYTHSSGGTLYGYIFQDGELVARQYGSFHVCPLRKEDL